MRAQLGQWYGLNDSDLVRIFPNLRNFGAIPSLFLIERQAFMAIRTCTSINSRSLNPVNRRFRFKVAPSLFLTLQIHESQKKSKV
jgi:hypothetical protein